MCEDAIERSGDRVEVWWADIHDVRPELDRLAQTLALHEIDNDPVLSDRSRCARTLLRLVLLRYGGRELAHCRIEKSARGRPSLIGHGHPDFSITYSGDLLAIAVSKVGPVGIDMEQQRSLKMSAERQQQIMNQAAQHGIEPSSADPHAGDEERFLSVWTKLEAVAKARGDGIGAVLTELKSPPSTSSNPLVRAAGSHPVVLQSIVLGSHITAALVRPQPSSEPTIHLLPRDTAELLRSLP